MFKIFKVFPYLVLFLNVMITGTDAAAIKPGEQFEQANKLYFAKDYSGSIDIYRQILSAGYESPEVYYNLGNAYYRIGRLGYAILNYEKALKLGPKDEDIKHNLALANLRTIDRIETLPEFFLFSWWERLLNFLTLEGWTILGLIFYFLVLISIGFYFIAAEQGKQKTAFLTGLTSLGIFLLIVTLFIVRFNREMNVIEGVVVVNTSAVKSSPEESSNDAFIIHEGLKVKIDDKLKNWHKIRLIDGKSGWVKDSDIEII